MEIRTKNQDAPNKAEVVVLVGCGLNGDENNEPTVGYKISPEGLIIHRETEDGEQIGYAKLSIGDLAAICNVAGMPQADREATKARIFGVEEGTEKAAKFDAVFQLLKDTYQALLDIQSGDSYGSYTEAEIQQIAKDVRRNINEKISALGLSFWA